MVSYCVHLLHLIYIRRTVKLPAGGIEMRQAATIHGDLGCCPVSACRPRPWWTCSHGEVINDVTAESCRWRTDRGPKKEHEFLFFFFLLHMFALKTKAQRAGSQQQLFEKKAIFIAVRFAV